MRVDVENRGLLDNFIYYLTKGGMPLGTHTPYKRKSFAQNKSTFFTFKLFPAISPIGRPRNQVRLIQVRRLLGLLRKRAALAVAGIAEAEVFIQLKNSLLMYGRT